MAPALQLGNDVVDLADPRHRGKSRDERFLARVFTDEERRAILVSPLPEQALWLRWACKEAAFKTVSKARGPASLPTFNHSRFRVTVLREEMVRHGRPVGRVVGASHGQGPWLQPSGPRPPGASSGRWSGQVVYEDLRIALRVEAAREGVHALTWLPPTGPLPFPPVSWAYARAHDNAGGADPTWMARLRHRFSEREWDCISHHASARARLEARRALAQDLGVREEDLEIGCRPGLPGRRIPLVFHEGRLLELDLTLSHAGRFVAWAALREPSPGPTL